MEALLWISIAIIFYTFLGYGIIITCLAGLKKPQPLAVLDDSDLPEVTLLIAAYNEGEIISEKIKNSLSLNYPSEKLNITFVTDGSTDDTNEIINEYNQIGVFFSPERKGKVAAVNRVMPMIQTPITIFSDANVMINENGIRALVQHFQRNLTGAVSGEKKVLQKATDGASATGESFYWKYESYLKRKDAEWNSLVGSAGELFAIRSDLYQHIEESILIEDFVMTMQMAAKGFKVAYEPSAIATETASINIREETKRKVRISAGGIQAVIKLASYMNIFKFRRLSFQFISHRVLRWTIMPLALASSLVLSSLLSHEAWYYDLLFKLQFVFYLLASIGYLIRNKTTTIKLLYVPYYFAYMHTCVVKGWIRYFSGKQQVTWEKARRAQLTANSHE